MEKIIWKDKSGSIWTDKGMTEEKALRIIFWASKLEDGNINNSQKNLEEVFDVLYEKTIQKLIEKGILDETGNRKTTLLEDAQNGLEIENESIPQKVKQYNSKTGKTVEVDLYPDKEVIWTCGDGTTKTRESFDTDHLIRIIYWLQGKDNKGCKGIGINDSNNIECVFDELKNRIIKKLTKLKAFKEELIK